MWDFSVGDFADPLFRKLQKTIFYYEYYLHFLLDSTGPSPARWGIVFLSCLSRSTQVIPSRRCFSEGEQDAVSCWAAPVSRQVAEIVPWVCLMYIW